MAGPDKISQPDDEIKLDSERKKKFLRVASEMIPKLDRHELAAILKFARNRIQDLNIPELQSVHSKLQTAADQIAEVAENKRVRSKVKAETRKSPLEKSKEIVSQHEKLRSLRELISSSEQCGNKVMFDGREYEITDDMWIEASKLYDVKMDSMLDKAAEGIAHISHLPIVLKEHLHKCLHYDDYVMDLHNFKELGSDFFEIHNKELMRDQAATLAVLLYIFGKNKAVSYQDSGEEEVLPVSRLRKLFGRDAKKEESSNKPTSIALKQYNRCSPVDIVHGFALALQEGREPQMCTIEEINEMKEFMKLGKWDESFKKVDIIGSQLEQHIVYLEEFIDPSIIELLKKKHIDNLNER